MIWNAVKPHWTMHDSVFFNTPYSNQVIWFEILEIDQSPVVISSLDRSKEEEYSIEMDECVYNQQTSKM